METTTNPLCATLFRVHGSSSCCTLPEEVLLAKNGEYTAALAIYSDNAPVVYRSLEELEREHPAEEWSLRRAERQWSAEDIDEAIDLLADSPLAGSEAEAEANSEILALATGW